MRALVFILAALVLAGCSPKTQKPAEAPPPEAKAPAFPPALIREYVAGIKARCGSGAAEGVSAADVVRKGESPAGAIYGIDLERICPGAETKGFCGTGGCENPAFRVGADGTATRLVEGVNRGWEVSGDGKILLVAVHGGQCGLPGPVPCDEKIEIATGKVLGHESRGKPVSAPRPEARLTEAYCLGLHIAVAGKAADILGKDSDLAEAGSVFAAGKMVEAKDRARAPGFQHEMKNGAFIVDHYLTMGAMTDKIPEAEQLGPRFKAGSPLFDDWIACAAAYPLKK
ncbi:hypothetical protein [Phenylobacterium parvum]|uniref:Uncharacterized protein n=1 Tax=Phenylobacterium parvum TaxID=2201350 RepID=A0A2Z3HZ36_9CAUL|nr:hypothetical protein [Phenylobacterium parvum]AWM78611.1 hypothetical protein HYN04_13105 [Phenylobacterium parvum]